MADTPIILLFRKTIWLCYYYWRDGGSCLNTESCLHKHLVQSALLLTAPFLASRASSGIGPRWLAARDGSHNDWSRSSCWCISSGRNLQCLVTGLPRFLVPNTDSGPQPERVDIIFMSPACTSATMLNLPADYFPSSPCHGASFSLSSCSDH